MRNVIILGSGRSGTSMVAGTVSGAGFYMGENMMPPTDGNPKGYFESFDIEAINEDLIAGVIPARPKLKGILGWFFRTRPERAQRWLARVPVGTKFPCTRQIATRIEKHVGQEPFCFKDPRFCYTLPAWRPFLKNTIFLCVFRDPATTAASILKECKNEPYLKSLSMNFKRAIQVWSLMYEHIVRIHRTEGNWLFVHYNQALKKKGLYRIENFIDARIDRSFPDSALRRSFSKRSIPKKEWKLYLKLCDLAGYDEEG